MNEGLWTPLRKPLKFHYMTYRDLIESHLRWYNYEQDDEFFVEYFLHHCLSYLIFLTFQLFLLYPLTLLFLRAVLF